MHIVDVVSSPFESIRHVLSATYCGSAHEQASVVIHSMFHTNSRQVTVCCQITCILFVNYNIAQCNLQSESTGSPSDFFPNRHKKSAMLATLKFRANETYAVVQPANGQEDTIREFTVSLHA